MNLACLGMEEGHCDQSALNEGESKDDARVITRGQIRESLMDVVRILGFVLSIMGKSLKRNHFSSCVESGCKGSRRETGKRRSYHKSP